MNRYQPLIDCLNGMLLDGKYDECFAAASSFMHDDGNILYDLGIDFVKFLVSLKDKFDDDRKAEIIGYIVTAAAEMYYPMKKYEEIPGFSLDGLWKEYIDILSRNEYNSDNADVFGDFAELGIPWSEIAAKICIIYDDVQSVHILTKIGTIRHPHGFTDDISPDIINKMTENQLFKKRFSVIMQIIMITHPGYSEKIKALEITQYTYEGTFADCFWTVDHENILSDKEKRILREIGDIAESADSAEDMKNYSDELAALFDEFCGGRDIADIIFDPGF